MSVRTSKTHPLQIAWIRPLGCAGQVGITFCPGKKQSFSLSGGWDRNLTDDIQMLVGESVAVVVTLIENHEFVALDVEGLGAAVEDAHMEWLHLPIPDVSVPGPDFERRWEAVSEGLRARVRDGFRIVLHCKGGLGRAGTIAARLLIELGHDADDAIAIIRAARPGAIETNAQVSYVRNLRAVAEYRPSTSHEALRARAVGTLLGLAVGDAVGTTLEFSARDSGARLKDMTGGGPFGLQPGQWTDDTAMALALADSLISNPGLDEIDLMGRFVDWRENGTYSCTGRCFDIGITTSQALSRWKETGDPVAGSDDPMSAGNGSLMRLAPVALRHFTNRTRLRDVAARQSRTTHAAAEAVDACIAYAEILADAIEGRARSEIMRSRTGEYAGNVATIVAGSWRGKGRMEIPSSGYVSHSLEASLWSVGRTGGFKGAVLLAANLGGDADTTAAIAGQLAGAIYGAEGIPPKWLSKLAWKDPIAERAEKLFEAALADA